MKTILFATTNKGKIREIKEMTDGLDYEIIGLNDIDFTEEIEENGTTFEENATIKAKAIYSYVHDNAKLNEKYGNIYVLADDSGLEIDYYDKAPGVYSHRWLGDRTYTQCMQDVIDDMKDVPDAKRTTRFVCSMALVCPDGTVKTVVKTVEGIINRKIVGENGFGYDPFFYVPEFGCTTAQMTPEQKNEISHRGKALRAILELLNK